MRAYKYLMMSFITAIGLILMISEAGAVVRIASKPTNTFTDFLGKIKSVMFVYNTRPSVSVFIKNDKGKEVEVSYEGEDAANGRALANSIGQKVFLSIRSDMVESLNIYSS